MNKFIFLCLAAFTISSNTAMAQSNSSIDMVVATVNNNAITLQELKHRIALSQLLIDKKLTSAEFNTIKNNAVEQLINEILIRNYSKEKNIVIEPQELIKAIKTIEKSRGIKENSLISSFPEELKESANQQIKNSVLENKIISKIIAPSVFIPDYQVNNLLDNILKQSHTKQYLISQIMIKKSNNETQDLRKMVKIYEQLKKGKNFKDLVVAYSNGNNKLNGGELGWFTLDELNFKLSNAVKKLDKDEFSSPIKTSDSIIIVKVDDIKIIENINTETYDEVKYITFSTPNTPIKSNLEEEMANIRGYSDFLEFKDKAINTYKVTVEETDEWTKLEAIDNKVTKDQIENTLPGNFSRIDKSSNKLSFVYVVDKQIKQSAEVESIKARILNNLQVQAAQQKFKKLMQDLRKKAFIELR